MVVRHRLHKWLTSCDRGTEEDETQRVCCAHPGGVQGRGARKSVRRRPPPRNRAPGGGNRALLLWRGDFLSAITFEHF